MATSHNASNVKSVAPEAFWGEEDEWEDWHFRFKVYICLWDTRARAIFESVEKTSDVPFSEQKLVVDREHKIDGVSLAARAFYQLVTLTRGPPAVMLRSLGTENGFEAYRQMYQRYKQTQGVKPLASLRNLLNPSLPEATF